MEYELLEHLASIHEFSEELINVLIAIKNDINKDFWDNFSIRLALYLVSFAC